MRAFAHAFERRERNVLRAVVKHVLVDFVGDREAVPAHAKIANDLEFGALENFSRGIIRRIENDRFRRGTKGRGEFVGIERPIRRLQLHESRRGARKNRVRPVIFVERLEDHDFVARIDDRHHRRHHRFGRAAANRDLALGIDRYALRALEFRGDGVAERLRAPGDRVLIDVRGDGRLRRVLDFGGRGKIGKALREIDGAIAHRQPRHFADYGFGEAFSFRGKFRTSRHGPFGRCGIHWRSALHRAGDRSWRCA